MKQQVMTMRSKPMAAGLAIMVVLIGGECVRAAGDHHTLDVEAMLPTELVAAELDPVFVQKLVDRMRAPFLRARAFALQID
jgi:hypothetical protein